MPQQTGKNIIIGYKVEGTFTTPPGDAGAKQLRLNGSAGSSFTRTTIQSGEVRSDGLSSMGRLGSASVSGSYSGELAVGAFDEILESLMRSTWVAANAITVDNTAPNVSFQITQTNEITYVGTTTLLAKGLRVGDVVRFTNMSTAANNSINLRVKTINAAGLVVTVQGAPLTVQGADTAATLTILKKLKHGATPTRRTFYIDEHNTDIDASEVFGGCRFTGFKLNGTPDGMASIELTVVGATAAVLTAGNAPYYTSPTLNTNIALVFADATLNWGGTDASITTIYPTAFSLDYTIQAKTEPVIGSFTSPDVFDNDARLTGSLSFIRKDLTHVTAFTAETEYELSILLVEPEAEPKDCISFYIPRVKLTGVTAPLGGDGAMIETLPFMCGKKEGASATGYDDTMLTICTSAP